MSILGKLKSLFALSNRGGSESQPDSAAIGALQPESHVTEAENAFAQLHELVQDTRKRRGLASDDEAFVYFFLERILQLNDNAIQVAVTHGPDDGGIDAVHLDQEGAQVAGCKYMGAHVVACDYADSLAESKYPSGRARLDRLVSTWLAYSMNTDAKLTLNSALRGRIIALNRFWAKVSESEGTIHVPHDIYLVTNRKRLGIDRSGIERQMDYYQHHFYHYLEQSDLVAACYSTTGDMRDLE
jgi:hypothetical protein